MSVTNIDLSSYSQEYRNEYAHRKRVDNRKRGLNTAGKKYKCQSHVFQYVKEDNVLISVLAPDESQVRVFKDIDRTTVFRKQVQHLPVEKVVRLLNDVLQDRRQYAGVR